MCYWAGVLVLHITRSLLWCLLCGCGCLCALPADRTLLCLAPLAARKREMDDNSRRLGGLFWKLNEGQVAQHVVAKVMQMCAALDAGNWPGGTAHPGAWCPLVWTLPWCTQPYQAGHWLTGTVDWWGLQLTSFLALTVARPMQHSGVRGLLARLWSAPTSWLHTCVLW